MNEPFLTALVVVIVSVLLGSAVLLSRASDRFGIPVMLAFLLVGMLAGEDGIGRIGFSDFHSSFRLGTVALVLILFDGGLSTPFGAVRFIWKPAILLATLGVVGVAGLSTLAAHLCGFSWSEAALLGAIVSSTDAAVVFAVLRGQNLRLKHRVGLTLEFEAGLNDPMAVALTLLLTEALMPGKGLDLTHAFLIPVQFILGILFGWGVGRLGVHILKYVKLPAAGLYPVLTIALAGLSFGLPTLVNGSGFLGVYTAAIVMGNARIPERENLIRFHGALAWIAQVGMFLMLGLLVTPSRLLPVALPAAGTALLLTFLCRPVVVALCLAPFGYTLREILYMGWVGLRGAVPIVLATIPVMAGIVRSNVLFDAVFFIIVVGTILPGGTLRWVTKLLDMGARKASPASTTFNLASGVPVDGEIRSYIVDADFPCLEKPAAEMDLPDGAWIVAVGRGAQFLKPHEDLVLRLGDHIFLAVRPGCAEAVSRRFGEGDFEWNDPR